MTLALISALVAGFVCTRAGDGPSLFWDGRSVIVQRSGSSSDVDEAAIDNALDWAAAQWSAVACSDMEVLLGAETSDRLVGFDWAAGSGAPENENILVFRGAAADDPVDAWVHQAGALAITTVTFETGTGRILDADIEVNDDGFAFTACEPGGCAIRHDLKNTLTHELGHVLGLDHPPDDDAGAVEATMFASAAEGDLEKRDLATDDIGGLCALFPAGEPAGNCYEGTARVPPPEVRIVPTCQQGAVDPTLATFVVALVVAVRARRRRRTGRHVR